MRIIVRIFPFILLYSAAGALAQDSLIARVQQRMEDQRLKQAKSSFSYHSLTLVQTLDKQGNVEKVDTFRNWHRFVNDSLVTDSLIYSSDAKRREKENKKGKKEEKHTESVTMPKLTDPALECAVASAAKGQALVTFKPKKPKGGDVAGELTVDAATGELIKSVFWMPKMKWPVKEFKMTIEWTEAGGMLFPKSLSMLAAWNAIVSKGRIRVETEISDIKIE
jgi:hypothetical protein